jgi:extradiol dioxygenase family protein
MARKRTAHTPLLFKVSFVFDELSEHTAFEAEETAHNKVKSVSISPTELTGIVVPLCKFFTFTVRIREVAIPSPSTFFAFTTT